VVRGGVPRNPPQGKPPITPESRFPFGHYHLYGSILLTVVLAVIVFRLFMVGNESIISSKTFGSITAEPSDGGLLTTSPLGVDVVAEEFINVIELCTACPLCPTSPPCPPCPSDVPLCASAENSLTTGLKLIAETCRTLSGRITAWREASHSGITSFVQFHAVGVLLTFIYGFLPRTLTDILDGDSPHQSASAWFLATAYFGSVVAIGLWKGFSFSGIIGQLSTTGLIWFVGFQGISTWYPWTYGRQSIYSSRSVAEALLISLTLYLSVMLL
jgi:hypothetical protein